MGTGLNLYGMKGGTALFAKAGLNKRDGKKLACVTTNPTMVQVTKSELAGRKVRRLK